MKEYMKANGLSFVKLYGELTDCMKEDGFFELSGLTEMMTQTKEEMEKEDSKVTKMPQDHKKKSTGTK